MPSPAQAYWYGPPQNLTATDLGGGRTQFAWDPPNKDNYRGVTPTEYWITVRSGYRYYSCEGASSSYKVNGNSCIVAGLPYGTSVTLEVQAWSPYIGDEAVASFVLCCELPAAPAAIAATAGDGVIALSWTPPSNVGRAGEAFTYSVEVRPGGKVCSTSENSCQVSGLTNGVGYTFYVSASNKTGSGPAASSTLITPVGLPSPPLAVQAFLDKGSALVAWQGPASTGGAPITRYVVTSEPDGLSCETAGALECRVDGLTNGNTYSFKVTAFNSAGPSAASDPSKSAKLLAVPSTPLSVKVVRKGNSVSVSWRPSKSNGGSSITQYLVTSSPDNRSCKATRNMQCSISGLRAGSEYEFSVQARNRSGLSVPARSKKVTIPLPPKQEQVLS